MTETRIELTDNQRAKLCKMLHSMLLCGICEALLDRATDKKAAKALDDLERKKNRNRGQVEPGSVRRAYPIGGKSPGGGDG